MKKSKIGIGIVIVAMGFFLCYYAHFEENIIIGAIMWIMGIISNAIVLMNVFPKFVEIIDKFHQ